MKTEGAGRTGREGWARTNARAEGAHHKGVGYKGKLLASLACRDMVTPRDMVTQRYHDTHMGLRYLSGILGFEHVPFRSGSSLA